MTFRDFFLESFKDLPEEVISQIRIMAKRVKDSVWNPIKKPEVLGIIEAETRSMPLIRKVCIILDPKKNPGAHAQFEEKNGKTNIILYQTRIQGMNLADLEELLAHETIHLVQHYQKEGPAYKKVVQDLLKHKATDLTDYHLDPTEFEAHLGAIRFQLFNRYQNIKRSTLEIQRSDAQWSKQRNLLLKELEQFIRTPLSESLSNGFSLPTWIKSNTKFLQSLLKSPKHLKILKTRLYQVWTELKNLQ